VSLISLRKSISEYDQLHALLEAGAREQKAVLGTLQQNVLDIDTVATAELQRFLRASMEQLQTMKQAEVLESVRVGFAREWPLYSERSTVRFREIREELSETVRVLQDMVAELSSGTLSSPEDQMKQELNSLRQLSQLDDLEGIREGVRRCVRSLAECLEEIKKARGSMIAHLQDEIRSLQKNIVRAEHSAATDYVTGLANRREIERMIGNAALGEQSFCVLYVWLSNYKALERELPRRAADQLITLFTTDLRQQSSAGQQLGRWSDDEFCAVLNLERTAALQISRELAAQIGKGYQVKGHGSNRMVVLQAKLGVVESMLGESAERFLLRADRLLRTIQGRV
jgi:diguanylate cyclase (GGDEF)-like protein